MIIDTVSVSCSPFSNEWSSQTKYEIRGQCEQVVFSYTAFSFSLLWLATPMQYFGNETHQFILTCSISSCNCWVLFFIRSILLCFSSCWKELAQKGQWTSLNNVPSTPYLWRSVSWQKEKRQVNPPHFWSHTQLLTSRFWHSCAELVGSPIHFISFFSLEMMFMAIRTLRASYTRRRMFFWSYAWKDHCSVMIPEEWRNSGGFLVLLKQSTKFCETEAARMSFTSSWCNFWEIWTTHGQHWRKRIKFHQEINFKTICATELFIEFTGPRWGCP